jgi:hypothetical protein
VRAARPGGPSSARGPGRIALAALALAALALALCALSCAAPLRIAAWADPLAILEPGSLAYARLSGPVASDLAPGLLGAAEAESLKPILARTRIAALGFGSRPRAAGEGGATEAPPPALQAALVGDFPFRAASLSLGSSPDWKREKSAYYNARLGLRAAVPGSSLVLASTGSLDPLLAAARAPGPSPIPERLSGPAASELVIWIPEPFAGLAAIALGEAMDVPARGLLIAASPEGPDRRGYEARVVFVMADADSARIYRPALKLAWYGVARALLGDAAGEALGASFSLDGELYGASGVSLSRDALVRALGGLRGLAP